MKFCRKDKRVVPDDATVCPFHKTAQCLSEFGAGAKSATPGPRAPGASDDQKLHSELLALEGRLHAGKRRSWLLIAGTACAVGLGLAAWLIYHVNRVGSYASLDGEITMTRDARDPSKVAVVYRPVSAGVVGFSRSDSGRETELLDRVVSASNGSDQTLEWRWNGVKEGDSLRATYRDGWSVATRVLQVPAAPEPPPKLEYMDVVIIVIENSDRFSAQHVEQLKQVATVIIENNDWQEAGMSVAVVSSETSGGTLHKPSDNKQQALDAIAGIRPARDVSLAGALQKMNAQLERVRGQRRFLVLTAGSAVAAQERELRDAVEQVRAGGGSIGAFGPKEAADPNYLRTLAIPPENVQLF